ncbi:suppressor of rasval19 [Entomophthora muscae]|uniref:Suppressor of rasval19 n=1 Tax=Entomophthora muscae TaxID=34485 RepID=A0ACC2S3I9_9FUNG|nr:suppressor of rasval19 [Entomophthora muscae]
MSEHSSTLAVLLKRLEVATSRIEELALTKTKATKFFQDDFPAIDAVASPTAAEDPTFLKAYDTMVIPSVEKYVELSAAVGGVVLEQSKFVKELFLVHQKRFLLLAAKSNKPASDQLDKLFQPCQDTVKAIVSHVEANRPSKLFNHLSTVSSGIPAVSWVIVEPETATCVKELTDSAQFFAYKVIKAFKDGDRTHVDWANAFVHMLNQLHAYVKQYHKTGLTWNPHGQDSFSLQ